MKSYEAQTPLGTKPSLEALKRCDVLLLLGTSFPYTSFLPEKAKVIQVNVDLANLGKRVRVEVGLVGTVRGFLSAVKDRIKEKGDKYYSHLKGAKEDWRGN
jgi:Thiamine pyrophosphate-requiring enzymes [acetolactate synthase, pyruvate dehydrogenase (cytochrome), glyoxylate carboligase, phosphonopyruvate decarboxylase]